MFMKKRNYAILDTVIGEHTTVTGNIESDGSVKIEGRVEGDIKAAGDVTTLANSVIVGSIWCENMILAGTVTGNIYAKNNLHLESTARLNGDVEIHSLVTDEGAVFEGNCKMIATPPDDSSNKKKFDFKRSKPGNNIIEEKEG